MEESRVETDLPSKMAHLDIIEGDESIADISEEKSELPDLTSRVLRKRKSLAPEVSRPSNRRVSMKPRKHTVITENANSKQIEALYLNKKVKTLSQTLETIYEEPKTDSNTETLIGGRKVKRLLTFHLVQTKEKIKKRRAKIKKMLGSKSFLNRKKIPMQKIKYLKSIECLDLDEVVQTETTLPTNDKIDKLV